MPVRITTCLGVGIPTPPKKKKQANGVWTPGIYLDFDKGYVSQQSCVAMGSWKKNCRKKHHSDILFFRHGRLLE